MIKELYNKVVSKITTKNPIFISKNYYCRINNMDIVKVETKTVPQTIEILESNFPGAHKEIIKIDSLEIAYRYYNPKEIEGYNFLNWIITEKL